MFRKLKGILSMNGMTQQDLANLLDLSASTLSFKINGKTEFTLNEAKKISKYFNMTIEDIFE